MASKEKGGLIKMYKNIVLRLIMFDLALCFFPIGLGGWMIWIGTKNLKKAPNPKVGFTVAGLFILFGLSGFYGYRMDFYDYYQYLKKGDNYLKSDICKVTDIAYTTMNRIAWGDENIKCASGKWYRIRLQHTYCSNIQRGQTLKLTYLPNSKMILGIQYLKYNK